MKKQYLTALLLQLCIVGQVVAQDERPTTSYASLHDPVMFETEASQTRSASSHFTLGSEVFENSPEIDAAKALYGQIPGLRIEQNAGPSSSNGSSLTIHGKYPLILVDGFARNLSSVIPAEVQSVTVLTDATATALYGVEGADGVVLITTKRGQNSKLKVTANYQFGLTSAMRQPEFADSYTYATKLNEALWMNGDSPRYNASELDAFKSGLYPYEYPNVDWLKQVYNDFAYNHRANLTFNGGNEKFRYFSAIDYMHDTSLFRSETTDSRYSIDPTDVRLNVRANIDVNLTPTTYMQLGVYGRIAEINESAGQSAAQQAAYNTPSGVFPIKTQDGYYGSADGYGANNAVALLNDTGNSRYSTSTLNTNLMLRQDLSIITDGLSADATVRFDNIGVMSDNTSKTYRYDQYNASIDEETGILVTSPSYLSENSQVLSYSPSYESLSLSTDLRARINYDYVTSKHNVNSYLMYNQQSLSYDGRNNTIKRMSYLAKASYSYDSRYMIDAVVNYAGTAFLPEGEKFNLYPAVSVGWVASNESFMQDSEIVDFLKVSASYGLSGDDGSLEHEMYRQFYGSDNAREYYFSKDWEPYWGQAENDLPVEVIAPEQSEKVTLTIEAQLFDSRLSLFANGFYDKRSNILVNSNSVSSVIGIATARQCVGRSNFWGADFSAQWSDKVGDFGYTLRASGGILASEVVDNGQAFQNYDYLYQAGNSVWQRYGLEATGIFQDQMQINNSPKQLFSDDVKPGDLIYKDQNGDNVIDSEDIVKMYGSSVPKFNFGFGIDLSYKGFELIADFQGVIGVTGSLLNSPLYSPLQNYGNISNTYLERETNWTPETNSTATMPRLTTLSNANNSQSSSWWYRDMSFLKLRNLTFAYTFPRDLVKIADIKVYLQGTNLFSIDSLKFADPENISSYYPMVKSYWAGVKFNF